MKKHVLTDEELFCLEGCRDYEQYFEMRKRFESEACPFCNVDTKTNTILYEDESWMVWENPYPRKTLMVQLVIVCKWHVRFLEELPEEAWLDFFRVIQWIEGTEGKYSLGKGGNLHVRFGPMNDNAGTVPHLHWNYWIPNGTGEVKIPVFKDPKDREKNKVRAAEFATRYEAGEFPV
ncbi:MAG: hypothetical protein K9M10_00080 [Candidatus Pacebacteria bacterium]|nr:hypothetical protein [Candidatus Paceibacterota bacterium]MCF7856863.1 hypothetical protein [Candidatus Paceibacterota bacterium]